LLFVGLFMRKKGGFAVFDVYTILGKMPEHMMYKEAVSDALHLYGSKALKDRADKMEYCGTYVEFGVSETGDIGLTGGNFCKQRLCPMCQWRRSLKVYKRLRTAAELLGESYSYQLLTVSRPNCTADKLGDEITTLYKNCDKLLRLPQLRSKKELQRLQSAVDGDIILPDVKNAVKGYFRAFECTYNSLENTWHPHLHIILAVNKSYYNSRYYISRERYVAAWNALNGWRRSDAGYDLSLDIRKISNIGGGLAEVCKYATKPLTGIDHSDDSRRLAAEHLAVVNDMLHGRRLIRAAGCIAEALRCDTPDELDFNELEGERLVYEYGFEYSRDSGYKLLPEKLARKAKRDIAPPRNIK